MSESSLLQRAVQLHRSGRRAEAAQLYEAVLRQNPRDFFALYFLGFSFFETGQFQQAVELIERAVQVNPRSPDALYNLGCALQKLQQQERAIACFDAALAIKPDYAVAWSNRGGALLALSRYPEAIVSFDRAMALEPKDIETLSNRATALFELGSYDGAAADYQSVFEFAPDLPYALGNLALARAYCCDWRSASSHIEQVTRQVRAGKPAISPHAAVLLLNDPADQRVCAELWSEAQAPVNTGRTADSAIGGERLRIAYVSADFHEHATSMLLVGVLELHDRERFEIIGISLGPDDRSGLRKRVVAAFDQFFDMRAASDDDIARKIRGLGCAIAVDLKGFTQGARPGIFARRAASIQVNYLGHPGTMGAEYIDYIVADEVVIPREAQPCYSEKVVWLPGCYQANDTNRTIGRVPTRAAAGLPEHAFVFCCFNNAPKITREVFAVWIRLLQRVEESVLWLLSTNDAAVANLMRAAANGGVDPKRLIFAPRRAPDDHLARHALADLFLDTWPCSAHTAASDALWAGLPIVTILGATFAGRVAASVLTALELGELVATSATEYENMAVALSQDPERLKRLRSVMSERRTSAGPFQTLAFTRNLERAYAAMWERRRQNLPPEAFAVAPA